MRARILAAAASAALTVPLLTACAGGELQTFCSDLEAAGGNAVDLGTLQVWLPKEQLQPQVEHRLAVYETVTPPEEIADEWSQMRDYYADIVPAVEQLPAGGTVDGEFLTRGNDLGDASGEVFETANEHCT